MNQYSMVAFIVFVSCIAWVAHAWITSGRGTGDVLQKINQSLGGDFENLDELMGSSRSAASKIAALEERVEVLERIVTDKKYALNQELDKLRSS